MSPEEGEIAAFAYIGTAACRLAVRHIQRRRLQVRRERDLCLYLEAVHMAPGTLGKDSLVANGYAAPVNLRHVRRFLGDSDQALVDGLLKVMDSELDGGKRLPIRVYANKVGAPPNTVSQQFSRIARKVRTRFTGYASAA